MKLMDEINEIINEIPVISPEKQRILKNRWLGTTLDGSVPNRQYIPLIVKGFNRNKEEEFKDLWPGHIRYTLAEQVEDFDKMIYEQLVQMVPLGRYPSDAELTVFPSFGNAFLLSGLSLKTKIIDDTMEPEKTLDLEEIKALKVSENIEETLYIKKAIDFVRYAKKVLPAHIHVGLCFMMSPYDLAYLVRGAEIMVDMYTNPEIVHHLMNICTELFIKAVKLLKNEIGESEDFFRYISRIYRGGNILCEDCCIMLSPELHREFSIPYTRKALDALGGGWVHFCGDGSHLLDNYFDIPNMYGIQYGQLELNGDIESTIKKHTDNNKALHYEIGKKDSERWEEFFRRIFSMSKNNKYLDLTVSCFTDENDGENLMELWHGVQDH